MLEIFCGSERRRSSALLSSASPLAFRDRHFAFTSYTQQSGNSDSDNNADRHSTGSSNSFQVIDDSGNSTDNGEYSQSISTGYVEVTASGSLPEVPSTSRANAESEEMTNDRNKVNTNVGGADDDEENVDSDGESDESVVTVKEGELLMAMEPQPSLVDLRNSVKAVIGKFVEIFMNNLTIKLYSCGKVNVLSALYNVIVLLVLFLLITVLFSFIA